MGFREYLKKQFLDATKQAEPHTLRKFNVSAGFFLRLYFAV